MSYTTYEVGVYQNREMVLWLTSGYTEVCRFNELAEKGIAGAISVKFDFGWNVDVRIKGEHLLPFIKDQYPERYEKALQIILRDEEYKIIGLDFS